MDEDPVAPPAGFGGAVGGAVGGAAAQNVTQQQPQSSGFVMPPQSAPPATVDPQAASQQQQQQIPTFGQPQPGQQPQQPSTSGGMLQITGTAGQFLIPPKPTTPATLSQSQG